MKIYLEIKNGAFLVWSVKSVGLQNVYAIKLAKNTTNLDWLKINVDSCQMFQFLLATAYIILIPGKKSKGGPNFI